ncbi:Uncharacterised protein [Shigella sonnei]|nr:Uncharacterised protein [Shigella sonnei]CSF71251.1 Uncharacterised protein [Shigella sonnei]CSF93033.1 Uncharacterised protein [Shigella sonnei]CSG01326.1 Uncharacterised protein [Shigella sonnei]CSG18289.1 Uncharacterised protein [Shigella sonnei]
MFNWQLPYPVARGSVQLAGDRRISLEETLRTDPQRYVIKTLCQRLLFSQVDLRLPFHNRHMYRLNIDGNNFQLR